MVHKSMSGLIRSNGTNNVKQRSCWWESPVVNRDAGSRLVYPFWYETALDIIDAVRATISLNMRVR